jgi:hypothetical protein
MTVADSRSVEHTLAEARAHFRAPPAVRERVRNELAANGAFGEGSDVAQPAARLPDIRVAGVSKPTVALLAGLTFVAGYWLGGRNASESSAPALPSATALPPATAVPSAAAVATPALSPAPALHPAPTPAAAAPAEPSASAKRSAAAASPVKRAETRGSTPSAELALLQRAEHAIRSGEPDLALSFLADLDRRHPETQFGEERTAARLMARCARGDMQAQTQAEHWVNERRASVYSDRVRELCGLER